MNIKHITSEAESIEYVDEGQGRVIIFLPGWGVTPATYQKSIEGLASQFRVVSPLLRHSEDHVLTIKYIIENLHLKKPFLIGHSASGIPAVLFAYRYPEKIGGIVLIDSMGISVENTFMQSFRLWMTHVIHFFNPSQKHSIGFAMNLIKDFLGQVMRRPYRQIREAQKGFRTDISFFLKELTVPVLILWGKYDDLTPLWEGYTMKLQNERAVFDVLPGGHDWVKIRPFLLVDRVKRFTDSIKQDAN